MKTIKLSCRKIAALLIAVVMCLSVMAGTISVKAADDTVIDENATGSITVTKYATEKTDTNGNPLTKGNATGTENDKVSDQDYTPLAGAQFKLFKISDATAVMEYYDGTTATTTYDVSDFDYNSESGSATYNDVAVAQEGSEQTTGADGTCTFSGLEVGIYALVETTAPAQITNPLAETTIISIPMVNTDTSSNNGNAKWIYDVHVYPKNHASTGEVVLTKVNSDGSLLKGAEFKLESIKLDSNGNLDGTTWNPVNTASELTTNSEGKIDIKDLPANLYGTQYRLTETAAPDGYFIDSTPLYFRVNKNNTVTWNGNTGEPGDCNNVNDGATKVSTEDTSKLEIKLTNEEVSFDKQVKAHGTDGGWGNKSSYSMGENISYKLTAYVPSNVEEFTTYTITDTPDAGLTDNIDSVSVTYGDTGVLLTKGTEYKVSNNAHDNGFTLIFESNGKSKIKGQNITISYTAYLNDKAVIAGSGNVNTATLTYSTEIGGTSTATKTIDGTATINTYNYTITKYKDSMAEGNKIGNVHFTLQDASDNKIEVVKKSDGAYRLAISTDSADNRTTDLVTAANGTIYIDGLGDGTYKLKETKTIQGYNLLSKPHEFTINESNGTGTIVNKKGFTLPKTGSMGFILFCVLGLALIAGGAWMIFGGKRAKKIR